MIPVAKQRIFQRILPVKNKPLESCLGRARISNSRRLEKRVTKRIILISIDRERGESRAPAKYVFLFSAAGTRALPGQPKAASRRRLSPSSAAAAYWHSQWHPYVREIQIIIAAYMSQLLMRFSRYRLWFIATDRHNGESFPIGFWVEFNYAEASKFESKRLIRLINQN